MAEPTSMHPTRIEAGRYTTGETVHMDERDVITFRVDDGPDYHVDGEFINVYLQKTRTGHHQLCVTSMAGPLHVLPVSANTVRVASGK